MNKFLRFKNISEGKALNIIQKPILTEKSTTLNQFNQYSFKVNLKATSIEIKNAIEKIFKVRKSDFYTETPICKFIYNKKVKTLQN